MAALSWSRLEPMLHVRPGWRRTGAEWHGPCPILGIGKNTCWVRAADEIPDGVLVGCRKCAPLDRSAVRLHVHALAPEAVTSDAPVRAASSSDRPFEPAEQVVALWRRARSVERTPAADYLRSLRACWDLRPFPPSVRWLPATAALFQTVRPAPPPGTAGLICYGYRGIEDRAVGAVQLEAVSAQATRIPWPPDGAPRVSAAGSRFDSGRQRFEVLDGSAERVFLVEGPVSALAAPGLFPELASGWSVAGVAGWAGFRRQAVGRARLVRICPDGDDDGIRAVERLAADLEACGIKVLVDPVPAGFDLLDLYRAGAPYGSPGAPAAVLPGYAGGQAASHGV